mmetsp:Transcript_74983/g.199979  ORF Transcript_74983/g.199979 Transcript_74983/m.199979 type:complete len:226 (-) Transcript_74983:1024-1701(-)
MVWFCTVRNGATRRQVVRMYCMVQSAIFWHPLPILGYPRPIVRLSSAYPRPFLGLSSAYVQPILGQSSAYARPILGQSSANPPPILGHSSAIPRPILGLSSAILGLSSDTPRFPQRKPTEHPPAHPRGCARSSPRSRWPRPAAARSPALAHERSTRPRWTGTRSSSGWPRAGRWRRRRRAGRHACTAPSRKLGRHWTGLHAGTWRCCSCKLRQCSPGTPNHSRQV